MTEVKPTEIRKKTERRISPIIAREPVPATMKISLSIDPGKNGILFERALQKGRKISGIQVLKSSITSAPDDVKIEIFLNSGTTPIASIPLRDILTGDIRLLNIRITQSARTKKRHQRPRI